MYRRFLNDDDYSSVITPDALSQMTRGNEDIMLKAESDSEVSIIEYLTENYEIEKELNMGKYIAQYDRRITFPVGAHIYLDGIIHRTIRSINGFKAPSAKTFWEETVEVLIGIDTVEPYSQFGTYYKGDVRQFNSIAYKCVEENGLEFNDIRIPNLHGWETVAHSDWSPVIYSLWDVVKFNGMFYTVVSEDGFDNNVNPFDSSNWGLIADYDSAYNTYDLSGHDYVVCEDQVFKPVMDVNSDSPEVGFNVTPSDPRNQSLKKHMVRLSIYELAKRIAPNNVSVVRVNDYEGSMKWLADASKLKLNPKIPRKLDNEREAVLDWQMATFQTKFDPYQNAWLV